MTNSNQENKEKIGDNNEINKIIDEIIEQAPECTVTDQLNEDYTGNLTGENAAFNAVDFKGRPFDKELHWVDDAGIPLLNKNGTLRTKRKRKNKEIQETQEKIDNSTMTVEHTGRIMAQYTIAISSGLFGKEFLPTKNDDIDELALMSDAYTQYLSTKDVENVPPSIVLFGCLSLYFLPRLTQPTVQEKITEKFKKIFKKIMRR